MTRAGCWLVALTALVGCGPNRVSLKVQPSSLPSYPSSGRTLVVRAPHDRRPEAEIRGASPPWRLLIPIFFIKLAWQGSDVTGPAHFEGAALPSLHEDLVEQARATGLFSAVTTTGDADLVLETEVLHLLGAGYRASSMWFFLIAVGEHKYLYFHGTVTLRLRLTRRDGTLVGERVVAGNATATPDQTQQGLGVPAQQALTEALPRARRLIAAWALEEDPRTREAIAADLETEHQRGHTILLHMVNEDRTAVYLAQVSCPSGKTIGSSVADGFPLVGRPGDWMLSPFDDQGVRLPTRRYDALSRHVAAHFGLARVDQVAAYQFLGERANPAAKK